MAIKEITQKTLGKNKVGWRYDRKRELWVTYKVDITFNGQRHVRRGFRTEKEAGEYLEEITIQNRLLDIGVVQVAKYPTVSELFKKRLADIENRPEKVRAERVFKVFEKLLPAGIKIDEVSKSHFKKFADLRISQKVSKKTVNREINPIAKAFSCVSDYFNLPNFIKPQVFRFSVPRTGRNRLIKPEEYQKLLDYFLADKEEQEGFEAYKARRRTGLVLQFALMTGLRHGEICGIEKSNLNRENREVNVFRFKTNRWKPYSPLTDTMLYLLDEAGKLYPDGKWFFSEQGKLQRGFYRQMKSVCERLEIPYGRFTEGGLILYDARHTFSTMLHQNLVDTRTLVEFTDNPTAIDNYLHSTNESKMKAMKVIENKFGNGKKKSKDLLEIYNLTRKGEINYQEFEKKVKDFFTVF